MKNVILAKKKKVKKTNTGWGNELEIHNGDGYCGRIITVNEGRQSSFHYHLKKNETFYVLDGILEIDLSFDLHSKSTVLHKGECIDIPRYVLHRFKGKSDATVLEISTYDDGEDDIVRCEPGDNQPVRTWNADDDEFIKWERKVNRILGKT
jgi:mannose-6-phosphate isomerase-like protein (cupin superfamily)